MPENENANRAYATFRLWGKCLDPSKITERLGVTPSKAFRCGDRRSETKKWPHGYWGITSQGQILSTDLSVHIEWLLDQLEPARLQITAIMEDENIHADIFCFWESRTGHGGPSFSPQLLGRIAALNLELGLDIYFNFDEDAVHWALLP